MAVEGYVQGLRKLKLGDFTKASTMQEAPKGAQIAKFTIFRSMAIKFIRVCAVLAAIVNLGSGPPVDTIAG